jgi:O-methyltransferase
MPAEQTSTTAADGAVALYLDLLKRTLTGEPNLEVRQDVPRPQRRHTAWVYDRLRARGLGLHRAKPIDREAFETGLEHPSSALTLIGRRRLDNLQACIEDVLAHDVPGDLIETGVWRGGATIFMRGVLRAHGVADRLVYVADSFRGLPPPDPERYPADAGDDHHTYEHLAVSLDEVRRNFASLGLLDDQVRFLEGLFRDTLPTVAARTWAVVRLDGDLYESTLDALTHLYPGLSPGGWLIVDDYSKQPCVQAVEDFRARHDIVDPIEEIDWTGACWQKSS